MPISPYKTALKAIRQLGFKQVALNALYRLGLVSGHYRRSIRPPGPVSGLRLQPVMPLPPVEKVGFILGAAGLQKLLGAGDEIVSGKFRQFGADPVEIQLAPAGPLADWTEYESGKIGLPPGFDDIKLIWEPARFGWAFILGRAYHLSADERYAQTFWDRFETFMLANPPYQGPNWTSGQEVGLRLMAWVWAAGVFAASPYSTPARLEALAAAVAVHAARIPATLVYAHSQNNNHLLTEAAALFTAGLALPAHPRASRWSWLGSHWLGWCFTHQIDAAGEYVQHSMNYHRLMLQTALWCAAVTKTGTASQANLAFDQTGRDQLAIATRWLAARLDPVSGRVPNLGANDGALIFPFSTCDFDDFRPTAQSAAMLFLSSSLPAGPWDEASLWFGIEAKDQPYDHQKPAAGMLYAFNSWASLRAVQYHSRPSHADQLHCDLWWRGLNIAQDAGTFSYNAPAPWDNRLTSTLVHNTVSVNAEEQMTRAGRFLYLDWSNAAFTELRENSGEHPPRISAQTAAYARLGVNHRRSLTVFDDERWLVEDVLARALPPVDPPAFTYRLHWLLPDWEWNLETSATGLLLRLNSPYGWVSLAVSANLPLLKVGLLRAGQLIRGEGLLSPTFGWYSPTYNVKKPALSLAVAVQSVQDVIFSSEFIFPIMA